MRTLGLLIILVCSSKYILNSNILRSVFKSHVCFGGLDSGNLNFETVRTDKQHICF